MGGGLADLADVPLLAVSLTRRPEELPPLELLGVAGVLYLPALERAQVHALLAGAHRRRGVAPPIGWQPPWVRSRSPHAERRETRCEHGETVESGALGAGATSATSPYVETAPAHSLDGALDALDTGVLVLNHDLASRTRTRDGRAWRGAAIPTGAPLATLVDLAAGESLRRAPARRSPTASRARVQFTLRPRTPTPRRDPSSARCGASGPALVLEARGEADDDRCRSTTSRAGSPKWWTWRRCCARSATSRRGSAMALARRCCE